MAMTMTPVAPAVMATAPASSKLKRRIAAPVETGGSSDHELGDDGNGDQQDRRRVEGATSVEAVRKRERHRPDDQVDRANDERSTRSFRRLAVAVVPIPWSRLLLLPSIRPVVIAQRAPAVPRWDGRLYRTRHYPDVDRSGHGKG